MRACQEHRWRECLEDLDAARALDPDGETDEHLRDARKNALTGIAREAGG